VFIEAKDDRDGGDNRITAAISRAKLQSNHQPPTNPTSNPVFFTGRMPFLSPNQQHQSTCFACLIALPLPSSSAPTESRMMAFSGTSLPGLSWKWPLKPMSLLLL